MCARRLITRRDFIRNSAASAGLALGAAGCGQLPKAERIVLITIDTLRADHLGCYGYPRKVSPFIDSLARNGVLFKNAFSAASHTVPAHVSIFTSLFPAQHKAVANWVGSFDDSIRTIAQLFADDGFETAAFPSVGFLDVLSRGFDTFNTSRYKPKQAPGEWSYRHANFTIDSVLDWISQKSPSDRFLLWIHLFDPHRPYFARENCMETLRFTSQEERDKLVRHWTEKQGMVGDTDKLVKMLNEYNSEILFVDRQIERLFNYMNDKGLNSSTLWIITADHGEGQGNHNYPGHDKHLYDEQIRVPLIFHFCDGSYAGRTVDKLVRHVDIFPTLAHLIGAPLDEQVLPVEGYSLLPVIQWTWRRFPARFAFAQRRPKDPANKNHKNWESGDVYCLRTLRFKYIYHSDGEDEFFDLRNDPFELRNLIAVSSKNRDTMRVKVTSMYDTMLEQSTKIAQGEVREKHLRELRALGYVR